MVKDNTSIQKEKIKPVISSMDFYKFAREKIQDKKRSETTFSESVYGDLNTERIYFLEDARMHTSINKIIAASAVSVQPQNNWSTLVQIFHHNKLNKTYVYQCDFSDPSDLKLAVYD